MASTLAAEAGFRVQWECLAPRAVVTRSSVSGEAGSREACCGVGYLERLRIEFTQGYLPFRQLWWGRAHAADSSLVWIRWARGRELSALFENGVAVGGRFEASPDGAVCIRTPGCDWETRCAKPLCDRNVRRSFPRWLVWLTGGLAPVRELKMAGPVRLRTASGAFNGSGIWEDVRWL